MPQSPVTDRMLRVRDTVNARLDRLGAYLPEQKAPLAFEEYLARASVQARHDPDFAAQLRRAMQQYQSASTALKAG